LKWINVFYVVKRGADPTAVQILLEDVAAISGVGVASTCLLASHWTGNPVFDAAGSCAIGCLLGTTAVFLIRRNLSMLVETSMDPHRESLVVSTLLSDPVVKSVHDVKSTAIGADGARFKAEVQFDGSLVAYKYLRDVNLDSELDIVRAIATPNDLENYLKSHGDRVVEQLAEEVDRLEIRIKKAVPEVKYCDLEIL
jgi:zinc transporter 9